MLRFNSNVLLISAFCLNLIACNQTSAKKNIEPDLIKKNITKNKFEIEPITNDIPKTSPKLKLISILATNDIHGSLEPQKDSTGNTFGGMAILSGIIQATKQGILEQYGAANSGVLVLDGGDQFQGTLLSNYDEGVTVIKTFNQAGYDAAVPGNHDYDFGPLGWLQDKVTSKGSQDSKEVIKKLSQLAKFPLLSANTYIKETLQNLKGEPVEVDSIGCKPIDKSKTVEFSLAKRPTFLKPYVIKRRAGLRIAIIGVDNYATPKVTQIENVSDLCFRDEADTVLELRKELQGKADLFIVLLHNGNTNAEQNLTIALQRLTQDPELSIDAIIGGHTHYVNNVVVNGVAGIQSGANGEAFGRIDLWVDSTTKKVDKTLTKSYAGIRSFHEKCDANKNLPAEVCVADPKLKFQSKEISLDSIITKLLLDARNAISQLADRNLGEAKEAITKSRNTEAALGNFLTDQSRLISKADIVFLNSGGIRDDLSAGKITYESFFKVLPINNRLALIKKLPATTLVSLLERSVKSCGNYGVLYPSGIRIEFERDCKDTTRASNGVDSKAKLLKIVGLNGEVILDRTDLKNQIEPDPKRTFSVATFDFLISGGSGYDFKGATADLDLGIARELIADSMEKNPVVLTNTIDGRMKELAP